jgi:hypothetical protein
MRRQSVPWTTWSCVPEELLVLGGHPEQFADHAGCEGLGEGRPQIHGSRAGRHRVHQTVGDLLEAWSQRLGPLGCEVLPEYPPERHVLRDVHGGQRPLAHAGGPQQADRERVARAVGVRADCWMAEHGSLVDVPRHQPGRASVADPDPAHRTFRLTSAHFRRRSTADPSARGMGWFSMSAQYERSSAAVVSRNSLICEGRKKPLS